MIYIPVFIVGLLIGIYLLISRALGITTVYGLENFPTLKQIEENGLEVVSNHLSLLEPLLLIGLFFQWYIFRPKYGPWNIAEISNYRRKAFRLMEPRLILVNRHDPRSTSRALLRACNILKSGSIVIVFPEGGRTFKFSPDNVLVGRDGKKIGRFKNGAAFLATHTQALVMPIWVNGTDKVAPNKEVARYPFLRLWRRVNITIGPSMRFKKDMSAEEVTLVLEKVVLDLA